MPPRLGDRTIVLGLAFPSVALTINQKYDKFIPVARKAKVAFSVDARVLSRVERIRMSTGESRSAVIGRALAMLTSERVHAAEVQRYQEALRELPETETDVRAARMRARRTLARLPWEDS